MLGPRIGEDVRIIIIKYFSVGVGSPMFMQSLIINTNIHKYLPGAESLPMRSSQESDHDFQWFEDQNITGWLVKFKARKDDDLKRSRPSDLDTKGNLIPMNALYDDLAEYDRLDDIAFLDLMKACSQSPKVKKYLST